MRGIQMNDVSKRNAGRGFMKYVFLFFCVIITAGCDMAYRSSSLLKEGSANLHVVPITLETVLKANRSQYEPLKLPKAFASADQAGGRAQYQINSLLLEKMDDIEQQSIVIETGLPEQLQPQPYLIGVGDVVMLSTPDAGNVVEALNGLLASQNKRQGYTVQDDGAISVPDIGRVVIGGLKLHEAEDAISQKLVEKGFAKSFSIEIAEFNSQKVAVVGAVVSPGIEAIALQPLYLDEAISRRGGISINDASFVTVRLYRSGSIYQFSVFELYNNTESILKILLKDGDRIAVETTREYDYLLGLRQQARSQSVMDTRNEMWAKAEESQSFLSRLQYGAIPREYVYIIGDVGTQSRFILPFENKAVLADALLESGGVSPLFGNPQQIYVIRGTSDLTDLPSITALHLDATNVANFIFATRLELRPKDIVFVGAQPITNWNRMINQIIPSLGLPNINIPNFQ
jgi:polysaccharide export outer membrane protein